MDGWLAALLYLLAGSLTGLLSGILGIGGGVIVVPALLFIFEMDPTIPQALTMHLAAGSSLAVMLFTSFAAVRAHHQIEPILWDVYRRLWPGIVIGTIFGVIFAAQLSTSILKVLFALFLLFVAYKMLRTAKRVRQGHFPPPWVNGLVSVFIGVKSGLLGVGGGVLVIPYLTHCGVEPRRIAAVSSLCTMTVAWIGTGMFMLTQHAVNGPAYSTGYVYWPAVIWVAFASVLIAPLGARLSYVLPIHALRYAFVVVLLLTVVGLLI
jgi:uncharacterized membrane protein YfcA